MRAMAEKRNILVTGAAGGMGAAICRALLQKGCRVWGLDRREGEGAENLRFIPCDLTEPAAVQAAFGQVKAEAGRLDAIIHTAGIYDLDSLIEMDEERFLRIFQVNLFSVYRVNRIFLPLLGRGGRILITTSELAPLHPLPFTGIYAVTKGALEKYAQSLRMELQLLGISVSLLRPGAVRTGLLGDSTRALEAFCQNTVLYSCNAGRFKAIVDRVEAKNVPPERIAAAALRALAAKRPRLAYNINRNPLLRLLNILPKRLQLFIIRRILK